MCVCGANTLQSEGRGGGCGRSLVIQLQLIYVFQNHELITDTLDMGAAAALCSSLTFLVFVCSLCGRSQCGGGSGGGRAAVWPHSRRSLLRFLGGASLFSWSLCEFPPGAPPLTVITNRDPSSNTGLVSGWVRTAAVKSASP